MIFSKKIILIDGRKIELTKADTEAIKASYKSIEEFNKILNDDIQIENNNENRFNQDVVQNFNKYKNSIDELNIRYKIALSMVSVLDNNKNIIQIEFNKLNSLIKNRESNILKIIEEIIIRVEIQKQKCLDFTNYIKKEIEIKEDDYVLSSMDFDGIKYKNLERYKITIKEKEALNRLYGAKLVDFERKINVYLYKIKTMSEKIENLDFATSMISTQLHALLLKETNFDLKNVGSTIKELEGLKEQRINELKYKIQEIHGIIEFTIKIKNYIINLTKEKETPLIRLLDDMIISAEKILNDAINLVKGMKQSNN